MLTRKEKYIIKKCGRPEDFCFDYIGGGSDASDIRRMRKWVRCSYKAGSEFNKKNINRY